jgi:hypothetical protein
MKSNHSKRIARLEQEMFELLDNANKPIKLDNLKKNFDKRASLTTTKSIIYNSSRLTLNGINAELAPYTYADITYTIAGGNISSVALDGKPGNIVTDTIFGVRLFGPAFEFELRITQKGVANFTFTTSAIRVVTGGNRSLASPVTDSHTLFIGTIPTI